MPDIHFECPKCKQPIDAPQELAAQLIDCPNCKETIEVPVRSQHKEPPKPPEPAPKPEPTPAKQPEIKPPEVGNSDTKRPSMTITNRLLVGVLVALIFIGIRPMFLPTPVAPPTSPVKWDYKIVEIDNSAHDDFSRALDADATHYTPPGQTDPYDQKLKDALEDSGSFDFDSTNWDENPGMLGWQGWELVAAIPETETTHEMGEDSGIAAVRTAKIVLIFKRPLH